MNWFLVVPAVAGTLVLLGVIGYGVWSELRPWTLPKAGAAVTLLLTYIALTAWTGGFH